MRFGSQVIRPGPRGSRTARMTAAVCRLLRNASEMIADPRAAPAARGPVRGMCGRPEPASSGTVVRVRRQARVP